MEAANERGERLNMEKMRVNRRLGEPDAGFTDGTEGSTFYCVCCAPFSALQRDPRSKGDEDRDFAQWGRRIVGRKVVPMNIYIRIRAENGGGWRFLSRIRIQDQALAALHRLRALRKHRCILKLDLFWFFDVRTPFPWVHHEARNNRDTSILAWPTTVSNDPPRRMLWMLVFF